MVSGLFADIAFFLTATLAGELALILVIKKDPGGYKFRPVEWYRDSNLEQYQKFIVVSAVAVLTAGIVWYLFNYVLKSMAFGWIQSFSPVAALFYNITVFLGVVGLSTYYTREKQLDEHLLYLVLAIIGAAVIWAQLQYNILTS